MPMQSRGAWHVISGFFSLLLLLFPVVSYGDDMRSVVADAIKAYEAKDFERARALFDQACSGNVAMACDTLAIMIYKGEGGPPNLPRARALLEQACGGDAAVGCYHLGIFVLNGVGGTQDEARARHLFEQACDSADTNACVAASSLDARNGQIAYGSKDYTRARELFEQSCKRQNATGCGALGAMLVNGWGGPEDKARGRALISQACEDGNPNSCRWLEADKNLNGAETE